MYTEFWNPTNIVLLFLAIFTGIGLLNLFYSTNSEIKFNFFEAPTDEKLIYGIAYIIILFLGDFLYKIDVMYFFILLCFAALLPVLSVYFYKRFCK